MFGYNLFETSILRAFKQCKEWKTSGLVLYLAEFGSEELWHVAYSNLYSCLGGIGLNSGVNGAASSSVRLINSPVTTDQAILSTSRKLSFKPFKSSSHAASTSSPGGPKYSTGASFIRIARFVAAS